MAEGAFWDDQERARDIVQQVKELKGWVEPHESLTARVQAAQELGELLALEPDDAMAADLDGEAQRIAEELEAFELRTLLRGRDDQRDAQLEISAGAGGTEADSVRETVWRRVEEKHVPARAYVEAACGPPRLCRLGSTHSSQRGEQARLGRGLRLVHLRRLGGVVTGRRLAAVRAAGEQ